MDATKIKRTPLVGPKGVAGRAKLRNLLAPIMTDEYLSKILFQAIAKGSKCYRDDVDRGVFAFRDWADDIEELACIVMELRENAGYGK